MSLTGPQFQQLQLALMNAFPTQLDLTEMVRIVMGEHLEAIAGTGPLRGVVYTLITQADAQGKLEQLVAGACKFNPGNAVLRGVAEALNSFAATMSNAKAGRRNEFNYLSICDPDWEGFLGGPKSALRAFEQSLMMNLLFEDNKMLLLDSWFFISHSIIDV